MGVVLELPQGGLQALNVKFANEALRTLCLAYVELGDEFSDVDPIPLKGYTCIAVVGIKDQAAENSGYGSIFTFR
ncbi:hypothetical protein IFM89_006336 [Coptis chinensis]|uniref:Uncharacterized protein n=1 Tax=Coptis chinensis TaxID=261450 RepID=A0A835I647_9MAGN|nr:hypothetical protein IFM89_006336 [Coptis chinensis]